VRRSRLARAAGLAGALVLLCLAGCSSPTSASHDASPGDTYFGAVLDQPYTAPDVTLDATTGTPYDFRRSTTAPLTLVYFGYTHCEDVCPTTMANLTSALTRLDDAQRQQVQVVFVTTDPRRDTTAELTRWLGGYDKSYIGLTGAIGDIDKAGRAFHIFVSEGSPLPGGGFDTTHGSEVAAIDVHDRVPIVWTEGTSSAQFASDLTKLLDTPLETS
jgi:protein SCO1/2